MPFIAFTIIVLAKCLVVELAPPHAQSAWGFRGERIRLTRLAACCNIISQEKKNTIIVLELVIDYCG